MVMMVLGKEIYLMHSYDFFIIHYSDIFYFSKRNYHMVSIVKHFSG